MNETAQTAEEIKTEIASLKSNIKMLKKQIDGANRQKDKKTEE